MAVRIPTKHPISLYKGIQGIFFNSVTGFKHGKRWTKEDINCLLLIRRLKAKRAGHDEIAKTLSSGKPFEGEFLAY